MSPPVLIRMLAGWFGRLAGAPADALAVALAFAPVVAWLVSFALFGPVFLTLAGARGASPLSSGLTFLMTHALGLLVGPSFLRPGRLLLPLSWLMAAVLLATAAMFVLPAGTWPVESGAMGLLSGCYIAGWLLRFASLGDAVRGRTLALAAAAGNMILYGFTWLTASGLPLRNQAFAVVGLLMAGTWASSRLPDVGHWPPAGALASGRGAGNASGSVGWRLVLAAYAAIFALYVVSGLMYQALQPALVADRTAWLGIGVLPYIAAAMVAGWWVDRGRLAFALAAGVACLGAAFPIWSLLGVSWRAPLTQSLLQTGWGLLDVSLWVFLARLAAISARLELATGGLASMVLAIAGGTWWSATYLQEGATSGALPLVASLLLFAAVPALPFLATHRFLGRHPLPHGLPALPPGEVKAALQPYGLSPRELEVAEKLLAGESLGRICELLFISRNTLKTHLRHIYRKCGVSRREELHERALVHGISDQGAPWA